MIFKIDGKDIKFLFSFEIKGIKYVAYEDEEEEISASRLVFDGKNANLEAITDDAEWDLVDKEIEKRLEENV